MPMAFPKGVDLNGHKSDHLYHWDCHLGRLPMCNLNETTQDWFQGSKWASLLEAP